MEKTLSMALPKRIFFTGVPGSRWSGVAQIIETIPGFNTSDRTPDREYKHGEYSGHKGAYFGRGMEFDPFLNPSYIDNVWTELGGTRLIKSHDWAYKLQLIKEFFPEDWIMMIYRPNYVSYQWWHQAGGFSIQYPNYRFYNNGEALMMAIQEQNLAILKFADDHNLRWSYFTSEWINSIFGYTVSANFDKYSDVSVTIFKQET